MSNAARPLPHRTTSAELPYAPVLPPPQPAQVVRLPACRPRPVNPGTPGPKLEPLVRPPFFGGAAARERASAYPADASRKHRGDSRWARPMLIAMLALAVALTVATRALP